MSELHCETCGRRVRPDRTLRKGYVGGLVVRKGDEVLAYCPEHARHRPPKMARRGWAFMQALEQRWREADAQELVTKVREGGRDIEFIGRPPLEAGQEIHFTKRSWCRIEWVRESSPGKFTARVRRFEVDRPRTLRAGTLPHTDPKREAVKAPSKDEVEEAAVESAYQTHGDPLDAGQVPPCDVGKLTLSMQAKVRYAEAQEEANAEAIAERQNNQLMRKMRRLQVSAAKYGIDLSPTLIGMIHEAERQIGEARRDAA